MMDFKEWCFCYMDGESPENQKLAWEAAMKAAIPKGYMIVPIEPTTAILDAVKLIGLDDASIYKSIINAVQESGNEQ